MGLLRAVGRTAVVAGTATAVSNRVSRRQATKWQKQADEQAAQQQPAQQPADQQPPPQPVYQQPVYQQPPQAAPAPGSDSGDLVGQIQQLAQLRDSGVLSPEEFAAAKAKLLQG